jgi:hypothetical protein
MIRKKASWPTLPNNAVGTLNILLTNFWRLSRSELKTFSPPGIKSSTDASCSARHPFESRLQAQ